MSQNFVDFDVYKKSTLLTKNIFLLLRAPEFNKEPALSNQKKRAVLSITINIDEGSEYNNNYQIIQYLKIAEGSLGEVRNMLIIMSELELKSSSEVQSLFDISI